jgi:hypothetical protein
MASRRDGAAHRLRQPVEPRPFAIIALFLPRTNSDVSHLRPVEIMRLLAGAFHLCSATFSVSG